MASSASVQKITNVSKAPRTFFSEHGVAFTVNPGQTVEVSMKADEMEYLHQLADMDEPVLEIGGSRRSTPATEGKHAPATGGAASDKK